MSDLVQYYATNPDPYHDGCMNSGLVEEGVAFLGVEPQEGIYTFIGITHLLEAVAEVYGLTPNQVKDRLTREKKVVDNLRAENAEAVEKVEKYEEVLMALRDVLVNNKELMPVEDD